MRASVGHTGRATARKLAQRTLKHAASAGDRVLLRRRADPGAVVLLYHRVGGRSGASEIDMPVGMFDEQLGVLAARRLASSLDDALYALTRDPAPEGAHAVVTFDDGTADFVDVALPVIERHRVPVVLYVATQFVEEQREFPAGGVPLSWAAIRDAVSTGLVTLGSHTHSHRLLDRLDPREVADELDRSVALLAERAGVRVEHFAYPKAVAPGERADRAVRSRFRSAALAGTRPNRYGETDPYRLARSPIQTSDGMRWFAAKLAGGMRLEDDVRRLANRFRYAGATS